MRDIPQIYLDFIALVEGNKLEAYQDAGGVWTIGRGHTGPEVIEGAKITEVESAHLCIADSHLALTRLYAATSGDVLDKLLDHQFSALLSFVYNLGADPSWTIWKDINKGNLADVPTQMVRFDKIKKNGVVRTVDGLLNRRVAEVTLWRTPDAEAAAKIVAASPVPAPPSSYTRTSTTPPAPASPHVPAIQSKTRWAAGAVAALGVASAISTAIVSAQHSVDGAGFTGPWLAAFDHYSGVAIAVLGVTIMVIRAIDEQLKTQ